MKKFRVRFQSRGRASEQAIVLVDDDHAYLLRAHSWYVQRSARGYLSIRRNLPSQGTRQLAHEILGVPPRTRVYHKNYNGLDCRTENLTLEHTRIGSKMHQLYALAGCYRPYYSELRP